MVPQAKPPRDKNDHEPKSPPHTWQTLRRTPDPGAVQPARTPKQIERAAAVIAIDRMIAARPLRPPPLPVYHDTRTTAAVSLANEIREGTYEP